MAIINPRFTAGIVAQMEDSGFVFYLTGSRYFGGFSPASDWDYFVEDSPSVRIFLENLGFMDDDETLQDYNDSTIVTVYKRNDIHIQLVKDAKFKGRVQLFIRDNFALKAIPKESRKHVWNFAIIAYQKLVMQRC